MPLLGLSQVVAGDLAASSKRKLPSMEEGLQPAVQWQLWASPLYRRRLWLPRPKRHKHCKNRKHAWIQKHNDIHILSPIESFQ